MWLSSRKIAGDFRLPAFGVEWNDVRERLGRDKAYFMKGFHLEVAEFEMRLINEALALFAGNIAKSADYLKMQRTTMTWKMQKYGIKHPGTRLPRNKVPVMKPKKVAFPSTWADHILSGKKES